MTDPLCRLHTSAALSLSSSSQDCERLHLMHLCVSRPDPVSDTWVFTAWGFPSICCVCLFILLPLVTFAVYICSCFVFNIRIERTVNDFFK